MRVAISGREDSLELNQIRGMWVAEDCEPVEVHFSWSRYRNAPEATEATCICPPNLAAQLNHMLYTGSELAQATPAPLGGAMTTVAAPPVV